MNAAQWASRARLSRQRGRGRGLVMLTLLIALMLASIALLAGLDFWALQRQRQQEEELLFREMESDFVQQLLRRLSALKPRG